MVAQHRRWQYATSLGGAANRGQRAKVPHIFEVERGGDGHEDVDGDLDRVLVLVLRPAPQQVQVVRLDAVLWRVAQPTIHEQAALAAAGTGGELDIQADGREESRMHIEDVAGIESGPTT